MKKRILALLLAVLLVCPAGPVYAGAATGQQVTANAVTVTAGNSVSVTLKAENFDAVASMEVYVYYDPAVLTLSSTANGSLLSGAQTSVNTADAGTVKLVTMSLDGISGSGTLLTLYFSTASACTPGTYPVQVAIGNAYTTTFAPASIGSANGSVTVKAPPVTTETFTIYNYTNTNTLKKGDTLSYQVASASSSRAFASGDFLVEYDHEIFAFEAATLENALTQEGAIYSVNSSILGQVRIAYASETPVKSFYLFTVKLKVIADIDGYTKVSAQASNMYREDLSMYLPDDCSTTLTLKKLPEVTDYPNAFLTTDKLFTGQQSQSVFSLEAGAGVAAADFTLTYDPAVLQCVSVTAAETLAEQGGMVIINDNFAGGTIRFSYINMDAYDSTDVPIVTILWEPVISPDAHYQVTGSGVGVVDTQQQAITLEYVADTGCIHQVVITPPTCLEDGFTTCTCHGCGDTYVIDPTQKLGHDIAFYEAKAPTCTEIGYDDHEACTRCDYSTANVLPALGHDEITHASREASCLELGWDSYVTCSRCDYSTYAEIPPLGHRVIEDHTYPVAPLTVKNDPSCPFILEDDFYYSQNTGHSSSSSITVTAQYDCVLELVYSVSSETNYDWLSILHNGSLVDRISGTVSGKTCALTLSAGDTVVIRYQKDGSVSRDSDQGWVKLIYEDVLQGVFIDVPADSHEPDCTNAVICDYCDAIVKAATGHSYNAVVTEPTMETGGYTTYTCTLCGHSYQDHFTDPLSRPVKNWNIFLADQIGMRFILNVTPEQAADATVAVTIRGAATETPVAQLLNSDGQAILTVMLAAAQMTDDVTVTLTADGVQRTKSYSVRSYADQLLQEDHSEETKNLVRHMLNYGGASQVCFQYNTGSYANTGISVTPAQLPDDPGAMTVSGSVDGLQFYGASMVHQSRIAVRFYFSGSFDGLSCNYDCQVQQKGSLSYIEIANICPQDIRQAITLTVTDGSDTLSITYAPVDYITRMYHKADTAEPVKALLQALYGYCLAAEAYK